MITYQLHVLVCVLYAYSISEAGDWREREKQILFVFVVQM
jgi:hypothetical protein